MTEYLNDLYACYLQHGFMTEAIAMLLSIFNYLCFVKITKIRVWNRFSSQFSDEEQVHNLEYMYNAGTNKRTPSTKVRLVLSFESLVKLKASKTRILRLTD